MKILTFFSLMNILGLTCKLSIYYWLGNWYKIILSLQGKNRYNLMDQYFNRKEFNIPPKILVVHNIFMIFFLIFFQNNNFTVVKKFISFYRELFYIKQICCPSFFFHSFFVTSEIWKKNLIFSPLLLTRFQELMWLFSLDYWEEEWTLINSRASDSWTLEFSTRYLL